MKNYLLIIIFTTLTTLTSQAQWGSLSFSVGLPQNDFKENTDATGFGLDLSFGFPIKNTPVSFGADLNYLVYGLNSMNQDLQANITTSSGAQIGSINVPLRITNTSSIFGFHGLMRVALPEGVVRPYAEGLLGFRYISTNTRITDRSNDRRWSDEDDDVIIRRTILDDWLFSYGYGGGIMFQAGSSIFIDLRANFFKGQRAEYFDGDDTSSWNVEFTGSGFDPDTVTGDDLEFGTETRESTTDLLQLKLGVVFILN